MNRPTPDLSQEGNRHSAASSAFPSWEGIEVGSSSRFKGKREWRLPRIDPAVDSGAAGPGAIGCTIEGVSAGKDHLGQGETTQCRPSGYSWNRICRQRPLG